MERIGSEEASWVSGTPGQQEPPAFSYLTHVTIGTRQAAMNTPGDTGPTAADLSRAQPRQGGTALKGRGSGQLGNAPDQPNDTPLTFRAPGKRGEGEV